jgi:DNA helicase-2/ATP-dependent DNA helicase PcrA
VADTIIEQKTRYHLKSSDIAILYRTNAQSRVFEEYLRRQNILYRVFGGQSFYQRKEIKDLIAYLRLAVNPNDEEALRRVINFPKRGIGASTVEKISALAGATDRSMWECMNEVEASTRAKKSLGDFKLMVKVFIEKAKTANAFELASYIAKQTTLLDLLKKDTTIEGMGRVENVNAMLDGIKDFVENDEVIDGVEDTDKSLAAYLQNIALLTDLDDKTDEGEFVTLMSIHSAKGLEFKSIFVVGLEEKLFPSFMSMDTMEGLDEERRLFYVAITRAEQFLTLTYANSRYRYGKMQYNEASRFLDEITPERMEATFSLKRKMETASSGAKVMGNFKPIGKAANTTLHADPATFKANNSDDIQAGMKILHLKFGEGKVISIDGGAGNRVATIFFKGIENPQRRIMLKYAKLQIMD